MSLRRRWNDYWFAPAPLLNLAMCRIIIVGYQLRILIGWDHHERFAEQARRPDELYDALPLLHLFIFPMGWEYRPSLGVLHGVYWITLASGWMALLGLLANPALLLFSAGAAFLTAYQYSFRDFHHPEGIMAIALTAMALAPAGRALAVDDLLTRLRRNGRALRFEPYRRLEERSRFARWPLLLVGWSFALIYFSGFKCKLERAGLDWMNGYTLRYYMYEDGLRWGGLGLELADLHWLSVLMSWGTMAFEATFFLVMLFPVLRWIYVPAGVGLHVGIWIAMRAWFFTFIACYAVFVPWAIIFARVHGFVERRLGERRPEVLYDGRCPLCIRSVTALHYLDWLDRLRFADLETRPAGATPALAAADLRREMHMVLPDGEIRRGFHAVRRACLAMPLAWPLLPLLYFPGAASLGAKAYRKIADGRARIGRCDGDACRVHGGGRRDAETPKR